VRDWNAKITELPDLFYELQAVPRRCRMLH
jgi:hypothetical protein